MHPDIKAYLANNPAPQSVDVLIADSNGILRGKQFPGHGLQKLYDKGANLPVSLLFCDVRGETPAALLQPPLMGDPDITYRAIEGSLRPVPWAKVPTAQIFLRATDAEGKDSLLDPITVLENVVAKLNADGMFPVIALEGEFYLLDPAKNPPEPLKPENGWPQFEGPQVYALEPLRDVQGFLNQVKDVTARQSIPMTSVVCEYGDSQFEMNLDHSSDIAAHCRDFIMLKHAVRNIAVANGQLASFMAMPLATSGGSGCHIHVSVLDKDGNNIFGKDEKNLIHAIGGLMHTMAESMAACAPNANSYRRYQKAGWSPNAANWGRNHRLVSLRIPISGQKDKRVEHRIAGADVNPYLLTAAVLAGIHHGVTNRVDPGPESMEGEVPEPGVQLPTRWREAIKALDDSGFFRGWFGDEFVDMFLRAKYAEEENFHIEVPDRDLGWCLRTV
ncbi:MAG: glutamine synthetase family protein [Pseudomonadota bacterium]